MPINRGLDIRSTPATTSKAHPRSSTKSLPLLELSHHRPRRAPATRARALSRAARRAGRCVHDEHARAPLARMARRSSVPDAHQAFSEWARAARQEPREIAIAGRGRPRCTDLHGVPRGRPTLAAMR